MDKITLLKFYDYLCDNDMIKDSQKGKGFNMVLEFARLNK